MLVVVVVGGDAERGLAALLGALSVRGFEMMLLRKICVLFRRHLKEVVVVLSWRGCQAGLGE